MIDRPDNVNVYILYAPEDEELKCELESHLSLLQHLGHIDVWHDGLIQAGAERDEVAAAYLAKAHIILLLISANFLAPDCYLRLESQLREAFDRQRRGEVHIIPVILRHCMWQLDLLGRLQPLPRGGYPIRSDHWESRDRAYQEVTEALVRLAEDVKRSLRRAAAPEPEPAPSTRQHAAAAVAPAPPPSPEDAEAPGDPPTALLNALLDVLCEAPPGGDVRRLERLVHASLFTSGRLDPYFEKHNYGRACERAALYKRPVEVVESGSTGRTSLGRRDRREVGKEVRFTLARKTDLGGFAGQVRVFYPADGGPPTISSFSL